MESGRGEEGGTDGWLGEESKQGVGEMSFRKGRSKGDWRGGITGRRRAGPAEMKLKLRWCQGNEPGKDCEMVTNELEI